MHLQTLDLLRCPYCGGRLELVDTMFHQASGNELQDGVLGCECCIFPVVNGIPVLHLDAAATSAREAIEAGRPQVALRAMVGLNEEGQAEQFESAIASQSSTYREVVESLGPTFEGGYFLYRFSDPTYLVASAVVRAVAGTVLERRQRAIDICGGSGHLTRSLLDLSSEAPILADLYFAKLWLARRFTAPGCEPICCDANSPMPFARGAFGLALCSDAFQYIWTKRLFVAELSRLVAGRDPAAVVIGHTHNQLTWSPSHGQPLTPAGYANLFETLTPRLYGEAGLFADVVRVGRLNLERRDSQEALAGDPALTIVASTDPRVYGVHPVEPQATARGEFRVNPLYATERRGDRLHLHLQFPSPDYEDEYGACKEYLPTEATIASSPLDELRRTGVVTPDLSDFVRRRVIVDLPKLYY
ncbi:MAG: hypothetical protein DMF89_11785 [Acidobacteria bacterium]|nr:MAG: hypothetical protein DMF89_11785 [Acidobacteriota bacterium]